MIEFLLQIVVPAVLLVIGYLAGRSAEKRHYRSIIERERQLRDVLVFAERLPPPQHPAPGSCLVSGTVVVSVDYFKRFLGALRMLVGGRLISHESLVDRARREAILRMKQQARAMGATGIFNVKIETTSISKGARQTVGAVEVLAYGTALVPAQSHQSARLSP